METPAQTCTRLLAALEDFAAQETAVLAARDFAEFARIQRRAAPLVELLGRRGPAIADSAFRARVRGLLERRRQTDDHLGVEIARAKEELQRTRESEQRVAQISSVYGRAGATVRQLRAVG